MQRNNQTGKLFIKCFKIRRAFIRFSISTTRSDCLIQKRTCSSQNRRRQTEAHYGRRRMAPMSRERLTISDLESYLWGAATQLRTLSMPGLQTVHIHSFLEASLWCKGWRIPSRTWWRAIQNMPPWPLMTGSIPTEHHWSKARGHRWGWKVHTKFDAELNLPTPGVSMVSLAMHLGPPYLTTRPHQRIHRV